MYKRPKHDFQCWKPHQLESPNRTRQFLVSFVLCVYVRPKLASLACTCTVTHYCILFRALFVGNSNNPNSIKTRFYGALYNEIKYTPQITNVSSLWFDLKFLLIALHNQVVTTGCESKCKHDATVVRCPREAPGRHEDWCRQARGRVPDSGAAGDKHRSSTAGWEGPVAHARQVLHQGLRLLSHHVHHAPAQADHVLSNKLQLGQYVFITVIFWSWLLCRRVALLCSHAYTVHTITNCNA